MCHIHYGIRLVIRHSRESNSLVDSALLYDVKMSFHEIIQNIFCIRLY